MDLSVIICTCNRSSQLKNILHGLEIQDLPLNISWEIIIVDNHSQDDTREVVASFSQSLGNRLRYLQEDRQGKVYALNRAIQESRAAVLVFTDDDVRLDKAWLVSIFQPFKNGLCDIAGGRILPSYQQGIPKWVVENIDIISGPIVVYDHGQSVEQFRPDEMAPFAGANMAVKKTVFDEVGVFNTDFGPGTGRGGEDTEFFERCEKASKKIYYVGDAIVWHPVEKARASLSYLAAWYRRAGRYAAKKEKDNKLLSSFCFGVPRYLWKRLTLDCLRLITSFPYSRRFINTWRGFFRTIGMIEEYRTNREKDKNRHA